MDEGQMQALVDSHMRAEGAGDIGGAVAVYTDDIEHDVVGFPTSPSRGRDGARDFYAYLTANFRAEAWNVLHQYVGRDSMILEQLMTGTVPIGPTNGLSPDAQRLDGRSQVRTSGLQTAGAQCDATHQADRNWV
jgi:SnoaL-like domain